MKNRALFNIISSFFYKVISILGPFCIRTIIIHTLGEEYIGLNSLFVSILSVLNIAELGFGSVITYSMYQPVKDDDFVKINKLLNFYCSIYRIIAISLFKRNVFIGFRFWFYIYCFV